MATLSAQCLEQQRCCCCSQTAGHASHACCPAQAQLSVVRSSLPAQGSVLSSNPTHQKVLQACKRPTAVGQAGGVTCQCWVGWSLLLADARPPAHPFTSARATAAQVALPYPPALHTPSHADSWWAGPAQQQQALNARQVLTLSLSERRRPQVASVAHTTLGHSGTAAVHHLPASSPGPAAGKQQGMVWFHQRGCDGACLLPSVLLV